MSDWFFAAAISDLLAVNFILFVLVVYILSKRRNVDSNFNHISDKVKNYEKIFRKRLLEIEEKNEELETLFAIADEKILKLMAMNEKSEALTSTRIVRKNNNDTKKVISEEINRKLREFKEEMNEMLLSKDKKIKIDREIQSSDDYRDIFISDDIGEKKPKTSIFTNYIPSNSVNTILPDLNYNDYSNDNYRHIRELAKSGIDEEKISKITETELSTVRLVLGMNPKKNKKL